MYRKLNFVFIVGGRAAFLTTRCEVRLESTLECICWYLLTSHTRSHGNWLSRSLFLHFIGGNIILQGSLTEIPASGNKFTFVRVGHADTGVRTLGQPRAVQGKGEITFGLHVWKTKKTFKNGKLTEVNTLSLTW